MKDNLFSTPALWYPGQSNKDYQEELALMLKRADFTAAFLKNQIEVDVFLDFLDEQDFDVFELAEDWLQDLPIED